MSSTGGGIVVSGVNGDGSPAGKWPTTGSMTLSNGKLIADALNAYGGGQNGTAAQAQTLAGHITDVVNSVT